MISSQDRSFYIGASDTIKVIGNWKTKTFKNWWATKLGMLSLHLENGKNSIYLQAGNNYEHKIVDALDFPNVIKDRQIIIDRLRVNLDAESDGTILEIKTHQFDKEFKVPKHYRVQVQVQMYASGFKKAYIVAYGLKEEDYKNFFNEIDKERIELFEIEYDEDFIEKEYKPRLEYLTKCLKEGRFPREEEFDEIYSKAS